ncbi:MAG: FHA domain-containing protein [Anaerolineae bacterium]|nr:FHA domain-containing protein [Anaerolineae bacterium]
MDVGLAVLRVVLAALLYAFLGGVLLVLLRDLRQAAGGRPVQVPETRLVVVETVEGGPALETAYVLQEVTSLGRTPANTIVLKDTFVSAHHALLAWREGRWWLEDQGSKNGTLLNDERVTQPTVVGAGDVIGVGRFALRLEVEK